MADPLTIASGIVLAGQVISTCFKYGCNVKDAPKEGLQFVDELTSLAGVLTGIKAFVDSREDAPKEPSEKRRHGGRSKDGPPPYEDAAPRVDLAVLTAPIQDCNSVLKEILTRLQKLRPEDDGRFKKAIKRLVWPFKQPETMDMIARLERNKTILLSAMTSTTVTVSAQVLDAVQDIRGAHMQRIYKWLSPVDPSIAHRAAQSLRLSGTGQWLFDEVPWKKWASGKSSFLWLRGIRKSTSDGAIPELV